MSMIYSRRRFRTRVTAPLAAVVMVSSAGGCAPDPTGTPESGRAVALVPAVAPVSAGEYVERRGLLLTDLPDGILLLHARSSEKSMEQWGFVQDASFLYYTGLSESPGAILALDGVAGEAHLFLPPPPESFGMSVEGVVPETGGGTAERLGVDSARPWNGFSGWLQARIDAGVLTVYVDEARRPEAPGVPEGMAPVAGDRALWRSSLEQSFPRASFESAKSIVMEQKSVKSASEVAILERNAQMTVTSLLAVADRLEPGVRQRETEASMVEACLSAGGQGPSFWPWTMSGPNAHMGQLVGAFFRYDQADRSARSGELVRVDIGCAGGQYGADVGRTLPVSGSFTSGQAEAWDLLITGYLAGLDAMADGVTVSEVRDVSVEAVRGARASLSTPTGEAAAEAILDGGPGVWHIHGVGIESGEDIPQVLRSGMVVAYEPGFSVGDDAYYLEDMVLVTDSGHRVLSAGLPYTAEEIREAMSR